MKEKIVIAIGGNAILKQGDKGTIEEQKQNIYESCDPIINLALEGYKLIVTHGNGPQVGTALIKAELASKEIPVNPLDVCTSETQGSLGYLIQQALYNKMAARGINMPVAAVVTQMVVDKKDAGFTNPTKPIGPFYSRERAEEEGREKGAKFVEDSGRGYRRVVPSPVPFKIIEKPIIESMLKDEIILITAGGGGIPVIEENGILKGVEAVIDKDLASALLAAEVGAEYFIILTGVEKVSINFGRSNQEDLSELTVSKALQYMEEGQFPKGSMGPKIEAAIYFLRKGGKNVIITSIDKVKEALQGKTGTRIVLE